MADGVRAGRASCEDALRHRAHPLYAGRDRRHANRSARVRRRCPQAAQCPTGAGRTRRETVRDTERERRGDGLRRPCGACRPVVPATDYKVQLPIRPNGSTGWVRAADVRLRAVRTRIAVDLSQRRITLFRDGRPVLVTSAVIGAPSTPTPTGRFYVNQRLLAVESPRRLRAGGGRDLGVLPGAPELAPGWSDRNPRHECPRHDRIRGLARVPSGSQCRHREAAAPRGGGNTGRDQEVTGAHATVTGFRPAPAARRPPPRAPRARR